MDDLAARVAEREWYHTIELPGGVVTPGFFDHRRVLHRYGLPERMEGMRVLDVATFDGFFAFEFERRGAEVVAIDVPSVDDLDWPEPLRRSGETRFQPDGANFALAAGALGSDVQRVPVSVYDVSEQMLGTFDLVFVGSLLLHLRDPVGALMALREVCGGRLHLAEAVHRKLDLLSRRFALAKFDGLSTHLTWWVPNRRCLADMVEAAGYQDVEVGKRFVVPFRERRDGVPHAVLRARN